MSSSAEMSRQIASAVLFAVALWCQAHNSEGCPSCLSGLSGVSKGVCTENHVDCSGLNITRYTNPSSSPPAGGKFLLNVSQNLLTSILPLPDFVTELDFSRNNLTNLRVFNNTPLQVLDISSNMIASIDLNALSKLGHLENLNLSYNQLDLLHTTFLPISIQIADLSHNRISAIGSDIFSRMPHLLRIFLDGNRLSFILPSYFPVNLRQVSLTGNHGYGCQVRLTDVCDLYSWTQAGRGRIAPGFRFEDGSDFFVNAAQVCPASSTRANTVGVLGCHRATMMTAKPASTPSIPTTSPTAPNNTQPPPQTPAAGIVKPPKKPVTTQTQTTQMFAETSSAAGSVKPPKKPVTTPTQTTQTFAETTSAASFPLGNPTHASTPRPVPSTSASKSGNPPPAQPMDPQRIHTARPPAQPVTAPPSGGNPPDTPMVSGQLGGDRPTERTVAPPPAANGSLNSGEKSSSGSTIVIIASSAGGGCLLLAALGILLYRHRLGSLPVADGNKLPKVPVPTLAIVCKSKFAGGGRDSLTTIAPMLGDIACTGAESCDLRSRPTAEATYSYVSTPPDDSLYNDYGSIKSGLGLNCADYEVSSSQSQALSLPSQGPPTAREPACNNSKGGSADSLHASGYLAAQYSKKRLPMERDPPLTGTTDLLGHVIKTSPPKTEEASKPGRVSVIKKTFSKSLSDVGQAARSPEEEDFTPGSVSISASDTMVMGGSAGQNSFLRSQDEQLDDYEAMSCHSSSPRPSLSSKLPADQNTGWAFQNSLDVRRTSSTRVNVESTVEAPQETYEPMLSPRPSSENIAAAIYFVLEKGEATTQESEDDNLYEVDVRIATGAADRSLQPLSGPTQGSSAITDSHYRRPKACRGASAPPLPLLPVSADAVAGFHRGQAGSLDNAVVRVAPVPPFSSWDVQNARDLDGFSAGSHKRGKSRRGNNGPPLPLPGVSGPERPVVAAVEPVYSGCGADYICPDESLFEELAADTYGEISEICTSRCAAPASFCVKSKSNHQGKSKRFRSLRKK